MSLEERIIVPERDEPIPGVEQGAAAQWLANKTSGRDLMDVARNGDTCLFWYIAGLLAQYKQDKSSGYKET